MKVVFIFLISLFISFSMFGQDDPLANLSGRAKAKALKQEEKAAKKDVEFQALMSEAHDLFAQNKFDKALFLYEKAKIRRPLNQFPKVKIEDVKLAQDNFVEPEKQEPTASVENEIIPKETVEEKSKEERVEEAYENELKKAQADVPPIIDLPEPIKKEQPKEKQLNKVEEKPSVMSTEELRESLAKEYEDGVHEKTFEEGRKIITERIVVKEGKGDFYRKVIQPWGQTYYFKNYKSASEYTWKQSFK